MGRTLVIGAAAVLSLAIELKATEGTLLVAAPDIVAQAAATKSIWDGAYTEGQAARGQERYRTACAACHAEDLLGAQGPALVGQAFLDRWAGSAVFDMVQVIKQSMPQEAPDSLGMPAYVDIVSYLLKSNGSPAGASELPTEAEALRQILVSSRK